MLQEMCILLYTLCRYAFIYQYDENPSPQLTVGKDPNALDTMEKTKMVGRGHVMNCGDAMTAR